jgi:hypothetical protein
MFIPQRDAFGVRRTVNAELTPAQKTWNLRSALNVAALNCLEPRFSSILPNYSAFLKTQAKGLSATNRALDSEFRQKYGATYRDVRDQYMTQVYNYFALPPALPSFCEVALAVSNEAQLVAPADLDSFAALTMPRLEQVYENFFTAFERYRIDVAAWDAQYGPRYGTTSSGLINPLAPGVTVPAGNTLGAPASVPLQPAIVLPAPAHPAASALPPASATATPTAGTIVLPAPSATTTPGAVYGPGSPRR